MASLPRIYLIHASDAPQHLKKLQEILQTMKAENRISDFAALNVNDGISSLGEKVADEDLVLSLLTQALDPYQKEVESLQRELQTRYPRVKIAETIIDNLPYENDFIIFPTNLEPIRSQENMDAVWKDIEQGLKDLFPPAPAPVNWLAYLKYVAPAVVVLGVLVYLFRLPPAPPPPIAYFQCQLEKGTVEACPTPCKVMLINASQNHQRVAWDFGDGEKSDESSPAHTYGKAGTYAIKLIAHQDKKRVEKIRTVKVVAQPVPAVIADFSVDKSGCVAPCVVNLANHSENADAYRWDFGDQTGGSQPNPAHTYQTAGTYVIKLTARKGEAKAEKSVSIRVTDAEKLPVAEFSVDKNACVAPCKVRMSNHSQNADAYRWDFDDGTSSTALNPSHTYQSAGTYAIKLVARRGGKQKEKFVSVEVSEQPSPVVADFNVSNVPCEGPPCTVSFTNQSTNSDGYQWDFGDESAVSTQPNPVHRYQKAGTYVVKLIARRGNTKTEKSRTVKINEAVVVEAPAFVAEFTAVCNRKPCRAPCTVNFTNLSNADDYQWDFGNGARSTQPNPSHTYTKPGTYTIKLTAQRGSRKVEKSRVIVINPGDF